MSYLQHGNVVDFYNMFRGTATTPIDAVNLLRKIMNEHEPVPVKKSLVGIWFRAHKDFLPTMDFRLACLTGVQEGWLKVEGFKGNSTVCKTS